MITTQNLHDILRCGHRGSEPLLHALWLVDVHSHHPSCNLRGRAVIHCKRVHQRWRDVLRCGLVGSTRFSSSSRQILPSGCQPPNPEASGGPFWSTAYAASRLAAPRRGLPDEGAGTPLHKSCTAAGISTRQRHGCE